MWCEMMKRLISIILLIIIIIITILGAFNLSPKPDDQPIVKQGKLELSSWKFTDTSTVSLDGEWEFYPDEFITPEKEKDAFYSYRHIKKIVNVPGPWEDYLDDGEMMDGVGTYRLMIQLPKDDLYGIKTNKINYSNRSYLNGYLAGKSGNPSKNIDEYVPNIGMYVGIAPSDEKLMEVVFHVASYDYLTGGMVNSVDFGTQSGIFHLRDSNRAKDALLLGGYMVITLIFFFLYLRDRRHRYYLYFCLLTLSILIHLSLLNERILNLLIPNISTNLRLNLQLSFIQFAALCFMWFAHDFFNKISNRKVVIVFSIFLGFHAFLYAFPPLKEVVLSPIPMVYKQLLIVAFPGIACLYVVVILLRAFLQKQAESEYVLVIMTTFLCYGFLIGADFLYNIPVGQTPILLFAMMIFFLALLMSSRTDRTNKQIRQLSDNLLIQDRIKDEFLAKTSVQLDEPLKKIKYLAQSLMEGKESALKPVQQEDVMLIYQVSQRLEYIVADLLNASEIKRGKILVLPKPTNLRVLRHVVEEMNIFVGETKNIEVIYDIADDLPLVLVDEQRLKQIIFNVLHNAIFYTNEGTVTLSAQVEQRAMQIMVTDTGIGMKEEELDNIFTMFYRGKNSLDKHTGGLGLGLAISKQLAELSGGRISVFSEVGVGSTFTITLPLVVDDAGETTKEDEALTSVPARDEMVMTYPYRVTGKRKSTILMVGHDTESLEALMKMLETMDYCVIVTNSGNDVLNIVHAEAIDLLIVDGKLRDITYDEVYASIRETYEPIELPIIKLLALGKFRMYDVVSDNHAELILNKPVHANEVVESVESLLAMKASAKQSLHDELSFFYAQIIPHFLYNTLNTIIGLTYHDNEKTREALQYLAIYFRAKLNFYGRGETIPLEQELELVEAYTEIEKMRFGDRINVIMDVDESIDIHIPPLTLQPLVENAIEHGLLPKEAGGTLIISIHRVDGNIDIMIEDDGRGMDEAKRQQLIAGEASGIGFKNAVQRLSLMKNVSFTLESAVDEGTKIKISIKEDGHEDRK